MNQKKQPEETYHFSYSARQRAEVEAIRKKYLPSAEDPLETLRRLDAGVYRKASVLSLVLGVAGCLLLGWGMSCAMVFSGGWFIPGVFIGLLGMTVMGCAYPAYIRCLKRQREKIAPEILRLTDELMK